jgi:hypothetical protein
VRLLLPRSGYAPQQKSGPQEVGITAEGRNGALGGHYLAGWSVLHALAPTPPAPRSQVSRQHARYCLIRRTSERFVGGHATAPCPGSGQWFDRQRMVEPVARMPARLDLL